MTPARPLQLVTYGDSILDCGRYNDRGLDPGVLLVKNDDAVFPEFRGEQLTDAHLVHRATDGATVDDLARQASGVRATGHDVAILTIGGNDLLAGLALDPGPGIDAFARELDAFLAAQPIRPVVIGNVYDPSFGDDRRNFLGIDPSIARRAHREMNARLADAAKKYGALADLNAHFLTGDETWFVSTIEPSLRGASEVRRVFLAAIRRLGV